MVLGLYNRMEIHPNTMGPANFTRPTGCTSCTCAGAYMVLAPLQPAIEHKGRHGTYTAAPVRLIRLATANASKEPAQIHGPYPVVTYVAQNVVTKLPKNVVRNWPHFVARNCQKL